MIDFIGCLKSFTKMAMMDQLNPSERATYMAIFMLDNEVGWKEWVSITNFQMMLATGIKDVHTITKSRNKLKQLGYIDIDSGKRGVSPKYKIIPLENGSIGENHNTTHNTYNNTPHNTYNNTPHNTDNNTIHNYTKTKTKTKTINSSSSNARAHEGEDGWQIVIRSYMDNCNPAPSGIVAETLQELHREYGSSWVLQAIHLACLNSKSSVKYIEGILKNWKSVGGDEPWNTERKRVSYDKPKPASTGIAQMDMAARAIAMLEQQGGDNGD